MIRTTFPNCKHKHGDDMWFCLPYAGMASKKLVAWGGQTPSICKQHGAHFNHGDDMIFYGEGLDGLITYFLFLSFPSVRLSLLPSLLPSFFMSSFRNSLISLFRSCFLSVCTCRFFVPSSVVLSFALSSSVSLSLYFVLSPLLCCCVFVVFFFFFFWFLFFFLSFSPVLLPVRSHYLVFCAFIAGVVYCS